MSRSTTHAQEFAPVLQSLENAFSDTEPSRRKKANQGTDKPEPPKAISDAEGLLKRRVQKAQSDEERARLKEDLSQGRNEEDSQSRRTSYPAQARATVAEIGHLEIHYGEPSARTEQDFGNFQAVRIEIRSHLSSK